ncbi:phosphoribosylanthranilate isomerase [Methanolobus sp. ZRKC3]|uniref:phosphoribosylanthranilate isomerase n=1 Tax=Methanolobus sp. ZRKC3 TaxID=3125786 RepID=UPI00324ECE8B
MRNIPRVKICGMKCAEDIELAVRYGADAVGFITEVPVNSPRNIDAKTASELVKKVPLFVDSVLVIMPASGNEALELINKVEPDVVQLHNEISIDEIEMIRDNCKLKIIKNFTIPVEKHNVAEDIIERISMLADSDLTDAILLDSGKAGASGGTGLTHDWSVSRQIVENTDIEVMLAGGLKPENVREAVEQVQPFAVDTASGVETEGRKDPAKICRFVREARCVNG